jgi:glycosyltransferase involved in cell wall biosynthesis
MLSDHQDIPLVSVIVPCFNDEEYIADCLTSICEQDYPEIEIIVVDDGSSDRSAQIVRGFEGVRLIEQENQGPAAARNVGIRAAQGDLIAFCDADDAWLHGKLSQQVACLHENPIYSVCFSDCFHWIANENGEYPLRESFPVAKELEKDLDPQRSGNVFPRILLSFDYWTGGALLRREVLNDIGLFDESMHIGEDIDLWSRIARRYLVAFIPGRTTLYRRNPKSITRTVFEPQYHYGLILEKELRSEYKTESEYKNVFARFPELGERLSRGWFGHGRQAVLAGLPSTAISDFDTALDFRPSLLKARILRFVCRYTLTFVLLRRFYIARGEKVPRIVK